MYVISVSPCLVAARYGELALKDIGDQDRGLSCHPATNSKAGLRAQTIQSHQPRDTMLAARDLHEVPKAAKAAEDAGFDAIWSMEAGNDGFLPLALAAEHTKRIKMGPAVAIAFPRSPMAIAYTSYDLARLSVGRFVLGLGTQVKGHIERRYGMRWEPPVLRCAR